MAPWEDPMNDSMIMEEIWVLKRLKHYFAQRGKALDIIIFFVVMVQMVYFYLR